MNTPKFKVGAVAVVMLALVAVILWQQSREKRLTAEAAALREQLQQAMLLEQENQRLTEQLRLADERSRAESSELLRLRAQATAARGIEQDNVRLKANLEQIAKRSSPPIQPTDNPFDSNHGIGAATRVSQAKHWGYALISYAANHEGRFPASFAEAASFLPDELSADDKARAIEAADRYELVYRGSLEDLEKLPPESTIIVREKEAWLDPEGRWCKSYCMSDGGATIRPSRKNDFEQWEALRIPKPKQP